MIKKMFAYGMVAALALALVAGTVYILLRPAEARAGELVRRGGPGQFGARDGAYCSDCQERSETEPGRGGGQWSQGTGQNGAGANVERSGGTRSEGGGSGPFAEADHPVETWVSLTGIVSEAGVDATIQTDDGAVVVGLGPDWYREGVSFGLTEGDEVVVTGFYEDGEFKAASLDNLSTGVTVDLRDGTGRPLWAGRGRNGR